MPKIKVIKPFKFAHHGYEVEEFEPSDEPRETTQEVVDTLKKEGFFKVVTERAAQKSITEDGDKPTDSADNVGELQSDAPGEAGQAAGDAAVANADGSD